MHHDEFMFGRKSQSAISKSYFVFETWFCGTGIIRGVMWFNIFCLIFTFVANLRYFCCVPLSEWYPGSDPDFVSICAIFYRFPFLVISVIADWLWIICLLMHSMNLFLNFVFFFDFRLNDLCWWGERGNMYCCICIGYPIISDLNVLFWSEI